MLSPGAKGWINKYFDLVENDQINLNVVYPEGIRRLHFLHLKLGNSGIVFGHPLRLLFAKHISDNKWTSEEKLKLLLFESHLLVYLQQHPSFDKDHFIKCLFDFYKFHNARSITNLFALFKKSDSVEAVESALANRVDIKLNLLENKWWVTTFSNVFVYLDVILFDDFLRKREEEAIKNYGSFALNAMTALTLSAYADGKVEEKEKDMFNVFLASANLKDDQRDKAKQRLKEGATYDDFSGYVHRHWLLKRFLLDISALMIFSTHDAIDEEMLFLEEFAEYFNIPNTELQETISMVENFVLNSQGSVEFLEDKSSYEKVYSSLSKRWAKVLGRNKDKIATELKESKVLLSLVTKSTTQELTKEEKEMVKEQLKDLAKSVPALTIFMLPGGTILMPILLKLLPDLVPSAFRENQIDDSANPSKEGE